MSALSSIKVESNYTGTFSKQDSVSFDTSLWAATNGTINWSDYPNQVPYAEQDVFHTQLTHTPGLSSDIGWTIRIGKGGQIYYIDVQGLGQITCPQRSFSAWNDDCMTTTVYSAPESNKDTQMGGNDSFANGYIHGSGMYVKPQMDPLNDKPLYCPLLAEEFDIRDRSYSMINWGLVPKPNINRGDVLFYSRYRDMGNGVLELTFYCYNFGNRTYNFAETPWWAVRPSKFPSMIEGINGTSSFKITNKTFQSGAIPSSGGWGAHTVNPSDPNSITCALVWGSASTGTGVNFGFVDKGVRDMSLIAPSYSQLNLPYGTGFCYRRYAVLGKLKNVANICADLNKHALLKIIEFPASYSGRLPLYTSTLESQNILSSSPGGSLVGYTYPIPIKNSLPLLLMKNNDTGDYFLSTDPYAVCGKLPFANPYPVGHAKYATYQNKHIYQIYDGKTEWVSLLGFVKQTSTSGFADPGYQLLTDIIGSIPFVAGEKLDAEDLMVPI
jgi:hypothetical protein